MSLEQDLKDTLARREGDVTVRPDSWGGIERGVRRAKRARVATYSASSVALLTAIALVLVLVRDTTKPFDFAAASGDASTYRLYAVTTVEDWDATASRTVTTGEVDAVHHQEHIKSVGELGPSPSGSSRAPLAFEYVITKTALYLKPPVQFDHGRPAGKRWIRLRGDTMKMYQSAGGLDSILTPLANPSGFLAKLRGVSTDVRPNGRATIRGVTTTRYDVTIDLQKLIATFPHGDRANMTESFDGSPSTFVMSVWIGGDGLLHRVSFTLRIKTSEDNTNGVKTPRFGTMTSVTDFYDYGRAVSIRIPAASETFDSKEPMSLDGLLPSLADQGVSTSETFSCTGTATLSSGSGGSTPAPAQATLQSCGGAVEGGSVKVPHR